MAIDVYLQIDGIKGESADASHIGWIECLSVNYAIHQPKSATASTGGGHTAERAELSDLSISKIVDLASPILAQACAAGKTFPRAKLEFMRADGDGQPIKYYEIELENVLIGHVAPGITSGSFMHESLGLKFSKVKWRYCLQKIVGGAGGNTAGGWCLSTNRIA